MTALFDLKDYGVTVAEIHRNLPPSALYEHAIRYEQDASIGREWRAGCVFQKSKPAARLRTSGW